MDKDEAIAELRRIKRLRERAEAAQKAATEATEPAIVGALRAGMRPVEIVNESGVSDSYVRSVRRANKIAPNPSYANLTPPRRTKPSAAQPEPAAPEPEPWAEPSALRPALTVPSETELPTRYRTLPPPLVADTVKRIARGYPTWHEEVRAEVVGVPPLFQDLLEIKRAHEARILDELGIELP